jgi:hypothetical protein
MLRPALCCRVNGTFKSLPTIGPKLDFFAFGVPWSDHWPHSSTGSRGHEMSKYRNWRSEFKKGYESGANPRGWRYSIGMGLLVGAWSAAAFAIPVAWYWCLAIYVAGMLIAGRIITRERRSPPQ